MCGITAPHIMLDNKGVGGELIGQRNNQGRTFLHELVLSGNKRALGLVLSPASGLAWGVAAWLRCQGTSHTNRESLPDVHVVTRDHSGLNLKLTASLLERFELEKMIDEFSEFQRMYDLAKSVEENTQVDDFPELAKFGNESPSSMAARFIRFVNEWSFEGRQSTALKWDIADTVVALSRQGRFRFLRWILEEDSALLETRAQAVGLAATRNEFSQNVTTEAVEDDGDSEEVLGLVGHAAAGEMYFGHFDNNQRDLYYQLMWLHYQLLDTRCRHDLSAGVSSSLEKHTFLQLLQHQRDTLPRDYEFSVMVRRRIQLLCDSKTLSAQLQVLDYLVKEKSMAPPKALSVIRWRQCGVLRWLVEGSFIDLHEAAEQTLVRDGKGLMFMGGQGIPSSLTAGAFLSFAAIEFDDLQSFEWLVSEQNVQLSSLRCNGVNAVHWCAWLGRAEHFMWLKESQQPSLEELSREECTRGPCRGYFASHIAAEKGFTLLAEMLLSSNCPLEDTRGKTAFAYAKQSELKSVRAWGNEKERPFQLEKDIEQLLRLLSSENIEPVEIKAHLPASRMMDPLVWRNDCKLLTYDTPGPLGMTYRDILDRCFKCDNMAFLVGLCQDLSPPLEDRDFDLKGWREFWKQDPCAEGQLDAAALKRFALDISDNDLSSCLDKSWARDVQCKEPYEDNFVLKLMRSRYDGDKTVLRTLDHYREMQLQLRALGKVKEAAVHEIRELFLKGADGTQIGELVSIVTRLASQQALHFGDDVQDHMPKYGIITTNGRIDLDYKILGGRCEYNSHHPIRGMVQFRECEVTSLSRLYIFLAVEGRSRLLKWIHSEGTSNWDAEKELCIVRIAAYFGHSDVVSIFLRRASSTFFFSSESSCYKAALFGAAEAGRVGDFALYFHGVESPFDLVDCDFDNFPERHEAGWEQHSNAIGASLVGSIVHSCIWNSDDSSALAPSDPNRDLQFEILKSIVSNSGVRGEVVVRAASFVVRGMYSLGSYKQCIGFLERLADDLHVELLHCQKDVIRMVHSFFRLELLCDDEVNGATCVRFLQFVSELSIDLQGMILSKELSQTIRSTLQAFQSLQLQTWSQFDMIKDGRSLEEIKHAVEIGEIDLKVRSRWGFLFSHLAAAYDRLDVLRWLVEAKDMSLDACEAQCRSVLQVAQDSNSASIVNWISLNMAGNVVAAFASSHFRRRRALLTTLSLRRCIIAVQALYRGIVARRMHRGRLLTRLDEAQRFRALWEDSILLLRADSLSKDDQTWQLMKQQEHDIMCSVDVIEEEEDIFVDTTQKLQDAAIRALSVMDIPVLKVPVAFPTSIVEYESTSLAKPDSEPENCANIMLTSDVMKWLRRGDTKYRDFFVRRVTQLAAGDRSRILAKRLTGSGSLIYETYLEQKSGQRILWTENDDSLLIWYVAKHKQVSRLMSLIDDAENRSSRQLTSASTLPEISGSMDSNTTSEGLESERIILDPRSDTPLKLYNVYREEIEKLTDPTWKPRLYLTEREREVVEAPGTVLLLGRSGTGKTCVISNRMDYDRQRAGDNPGFSQLFIARSQGLCDYVKEAVGGENGASMNFGTFAEVLSSLEGSLPLPMPKGELGEGIFLPSSKMDFARFKREFHRVDSPSSCSLDALVVWANIRSFIKGSIEALQNNDGVASKDAYLNFGKKRCRLCLEQRNFVYATFERYNKYMKQLGLWDDCDRVTAISRRLEHARASDSPTFYEVRHSKLYVDEVQDYTQAEVALFFYLCGPGDLFLAGDPAQSVVEGVEFRFEDIRSVGYHLFGEELRHLIPEKPKTVHINFRSHSGILNVAAAVLSCLFRVFPHSAKVLKEDRGLFQGPRPGVFHKVGATRLLELVLKRKGIVVLTHDRTVSKWKRALENYPLVYGIREAKGLEFREVVLVDFFAEIPLLTKQLLSKRLHSEAKEICCAILPLLKEQAQESLQNCLISRLEYIG